MLVVHVRGDIRPRRLTRATYHSRSFTSSKRCLGRRSVLFGTLRCSKWLTLSIILFRPPIISVRVSVIVAMLLLYDYSVEPTPPCIPIAYDWRVFPRECQLYLRVEIHALLHPLQRQHVKQETETCVMHNTTREAQRARAVIQHSRLRTRIHEHVLCIHWSWSWRQRCKKCFGFENYRERRARTRSIIIIGRRTEGDVQCMLLRYTCVVATLIFLRSQTRASGGALTWPTWPPPPPPRTPWRTRLRQSYHRTQPPSL